MHMCCEPCMYREENSGMSVTSAVEMPSPNSRHQPDKETGRWHPERWDSLPYSSHSVSGRAHAPPRPLTACSTHCQLQPTETTSGCSPGLRQQTLTIRPHTEPTNLRTDLPTPSEGSVSSASHVSLLGLLSWSLSSNFVPIDTQSTRESGGRQVKKTVFCSHGRLNSASLPKLKIV